MNPIIARSPNDGRILNEFDVTMPPEISEAINTSWDAFEEWSEVPAPRRGEIVRLIGEEFRKNKEVLAEIIIKETGKIKQEALGEVQECIDICDFAVGLSRQLYGLTIASERPGHNLDERWYPIGPVGIITAFNFPMAVFAWNAMLAFVCGDTVIWKPSEKALCSAQAVTKLIREAVPELPDICQMIIGTHQAGEMLAKSPSIPLISATGSTRMGSQVAETVGRRLGRYLLELGGNNAAIVSQTVDLNAIIEPIVFSAVGTCGQRCTTLRRLIVHESIFDITVDKLAEAYEKLKIGNPEKYLDAHVGPLIDEKAFIAMQEALDYMHERSAKIMGGIRIYPGATGLDEDSFYIKPAIVVEPDKEPASPYWHETFAPILYVLKYRSIEQAIELNNEVSQGLSSAIFTDSLTEANHFLRYSDCGIANVNIGTSGAEIGGAFGGEKDTGGGRESGSDSWRNYMRRSTQTVNTSMKPQLAQGIKFKL